MKNKSNKKMEKDWKRTIHKQPWRQNPNISNKLFKLQSDINFSKVLPNVNFKAKKYVKPDLSLLPPLELKKYKK
jgi:hypothetical protein